MYCIQLAKRYLLQSAVASLITMAAMLPILTQKPASAQGFDTSSAVLQAKDNLAPAPLPAEKIHQISASYGELPLSFEANHGQSDSRVKFLSRGSGYSLFLTDDAAVLALRTTSSKTKRTGSKDLGQTGDVLRLKVLGANANSKVSGMGELTGRSNYFIGNDPDKWRTRVPHFAKVKYKAVYPGVDLVYYGNQRQLEYDFLVSPGTDPNIIRLQFSGARKLSLDEQGGLLVETGHGVVRFLRPGIYQEISGKHYPVQGHYLLLAKNVVGFSMSDYDRSRELIIDPVLSYSTYLGGTGDDRAFGIAVDSSGNAYIIGWTSSADFPGATGFHGDFDVFVTKINASGSALVYSTYLGGSGSDFGTAIAVDSSGSAHVTGSTNSTNFPTAGPLVTSLTGTRNAFVARLSSDGDALPYSIYLGGRSFDEGAGIAIDSSGNAYVTGNTSSVDFPVTPGAFQTVFRSNTDTFITNVKPDGSGFLYSTFLGANETIGKAIAVDATGAAYVTGQTSAMDFPAVNPLQSHLSGQTDAFVSKISADGTSLVYSTYLGGSGGENGNAIAVDSSGNAYIAGDTNSSNFPTANPFQSGLGGNGSASRNAFVAKINAAGSAFVYSSYLGGETQEAALGIALDSAGNVYVAGETSSFQFPLVNPIQRRLRGGVNAFVSQVSADGSALTFSTYLGGSASDLANAIAVDASNNIYLAGTTDSADFPTQATFQPSLAGGGNDAFVTKISPNAVAATTTTLTSSVNPSALGQNVTFTANVTSGTGTPTGTVTFMDGSTSLGSATLNSGIVTFATSALTIGSHSITASYAGDNGHSASNSPVLTQVVNGNSTTTALTSSANPANIGQTITFTATVTSGAGTPTGTVTFKNGSNTLGTSGLSNGVATLFTSNLAAGSHPITANYSGDSTHSASISVVLTQVVNPGSPVATSTTLTSSLNPSAVGQSIVFIAHVSAASNTPSGTVTFLDGNTSLGTGTLDASGAAMVMTNSLTAGTHNMTAQYAGNSSFAPSTSPALTQVVNAPDFTISSNPRSATIQSGQSANFSLTLTPSVGFNSTISLACSGLPSSATCAFTPATLTPNGNSPVTATLVVNTTAMHSMVHGYDVPANRTLLDARLHGLSASVIGMIGAVVLLGSSPRRRGKNLRTLLLVPAFALILGSVGCGGGSRNSLVQSSSSQPSTSVVTITATAAVNGTTTNHSAQVTITIVP